MADPFAAVKSLIDRSRLVENRAPDQIRVNPTVAKGTMYTMALDEEVAAKRGIVWTPGATEVLLSPADWKSMVDSVVKRKDDSLRRVDDPAPTTAPRLYGIPVVFDE